MIKKLRKFLSLYKYRSLVKIMEDLVLTNTGPYKLWTNGDEVITYLNRVILNYGELADDDPILLMMSDMRAFRVIVQDADAARERIAKYILTEQASTDNIEEVFDECQEICLRAIKLRYVGLRNFAILHCWCLKQDVGFGYYTSRLAEQITKGTQ